MKKLLIVFVFLLVCAVTVGCNKVTNTKQPETINEIEENRLTVEDIVKSYEVKGIGKIISVTEYKNYVLVEYINPSDMRWFNWHNLDTGDMDAVGNMDTSARLVQIINENHLVFESDGVNALNGHRFFPFYIDCTRGSEATGYDGEFHNTRKEKYLEIDEKCEFGIKSDVVLSDVKLTLQGVEMLFSPMEGKEGGFYTAYTSIPVTATSYISEKNQFEIVFKNTKLISELENNFAEVQSTYIESIQLLEIGNDTAARIKLKEGARYYNASVGHLEPAVDDFPFVEFKFINKRE